MFNIFKKKKLIEREETQSKKLDPMNRVIDMYKNECTEMLDELDSLKNKKKELEAEAKDLGAELSRLENEYRELLDQNEWVKKFKHGH